MALSGRKYGRIFEASQTNPQLATVLKEQLALKEKRADLVRQIKAATDEKQKKLFTADLEKIVGQQFDMIIKHKQLVCEDLAKKLQDLNKELDKKKADIEKWKNTDFKNQKVKDRVNELLTESEKFEWD
jgi:superfamily II helicase